MSFCKGLFEGNINNFLFQTIDIELLDNYWYRIKVVTQELKFYCYINN